MKNIIFDLGGVIVPINEQLTLNAFAELATERQQLQELSDFYSSFVISYEIGQTNGEDLIDGLRNILKLPNNEESKTIIIAAWNKMLLDIPCQNIETLKNLSKKYRIFLLSNTNSIHIQYLESKEQQAHCKQQEQNRQQEQQAPQERIALMDLFEKAYLSYEIHLRKPDVEIYEYVLSEAKLNPNETLFIDDREDNINGAAKAGINTYLHPANSDLTAALKNLGL